MGGRAAGAPTAVLAVTWSVAFVTLVGGTVAVAVGVGTAVGVADADTVAVTVGVAVAVAVGVALAGGPVRTANR